MLRRKKAHHLRTGEQGERAARRYLILRGYRILECNYLCPPGEIDIIALKRGVLVFVEVRTRQAGALVDPVASITDMKLAHFLDAARYYLISKGRSGINCRFDILSVRTGGPLRGRFCHYADAFRIGDERPARGVRLKAWIRRQPRPGGKIPKTKKRPGTEGHR